MSGNRQPDARYTLDEFLAFEEMSAERHEYFAGRIYAMAGGTDSHNLICYNLAGITRPQLPSGCSGRSSDQMIYIASIETGLYPDLSIVCGAPRFADEKRRLLLNPRVIFEVLSPTTERDDKTWKWEYYQQLESLTDYLLVSQDKPQIEHYERGDAGSWTYRRISGIASEIILKSINCTLRFADLYSDVDFQTEVMPPPMRIV